MTHAHSRTSRNRRRGGVLIAALFAVMVVAAMATCLLQLSGVTARRQGTALDRRRAFYLAEAGLAEAYTGMLIGKTGAVGTSELPAQIGGGVFWVEPVALDESVVQLVSTGMWGRGRAELGMTVELGETSVASLGVFANQPLEIPPGTTIEGYDSSVETDDPADALAPSGGAGFGTGRIGSNAGITASGTREQPTVLRADLIPGPEHDATLTGAVSHSGEIEPRSSAAPLPPIEVPFEPTSPGVRHGEPYARVLTGDQVGLQFLEVAAGARVILQGPCNLVVDDLLVGGGGTIEFDTRLGSVSVWVRDQLDLAEQSLVRCSGTDTSETTVQVGADGRALVASSGEFYGVLYAPQAEVTFGAGLRLFGALVAERLVLAPGAKLAFDRHLDEVALDLSLPKFLSWRILELSTATNARRGMDPYTILGLDGRTLPSPAQAHADVLLHVVYEDDGGTLRTYDGMESGFDWTDVSVVHELTRDGQPVLFARAREPSEPPPSSSLALDALEQDPPLDHSELRDALVALSPLTSEELVAAIESPILDQSDLEAVLDANSPLGSNELIALLQRTVQLASGVLKDVLLASSPLPLDVVALVTLGEGNLTLLDRTAVLLGQ